MFYVIGLGNPGDKYATTRHNIGRMVIDNMCEGNWDKDKGANALSAKLSLSGELVELYAPETFMNKSGETAKYIKDKLGAAVEEIVVVHDEIDLPFGEIKVSKGKGAGGNNGIDSIIKQLGSKDFVRIRVGIAPTSFWTGKTKRPSGGGPLERFVLKPFSPGERKQLPDVFVKSREVIEAIVSEGVEVAMNKVNSFR